MTDIQDGDSLGSIHFARGQFDPQPVPLITWHTDGRVVFNQALTDAIRQIVRDEIAKALPPRDLGRSPSP